MARKGKSNCNGDGHSKDNDNDKDGTKPPYEVGYGRPPKQGQLKPGQSGNPKGRRKGSKRFEEIVREVLCEELLVTENGRRFRLMAIEIIVMKMRNQAMAGNKDARREALMLMRECGGDNKVDGANEQIAAMEDFSKYTVEELELLQDAAILLEGKKERPPPPLPPGYRWIDGRAVLLNPRTGEPYEEEEQ
jgi:hypothetical protein